jgi:hypothetical protein
VIAGRVAAVSLRALREVGEMLPEEPRRPERNPDARPEMDTLDDWILFGPRMR